MMDEQERRESGDHEVERDREYPLDADVDADAVDPSALPADDETPDRPDVDQQPAPIDPDDEAEALRRSQVAALLGQPVKEPPPAPSIEPSIQVPAESPPVEPATPAEPTEEAISNMIHELIDDKIIA